MKKPIHLHKRLKEHLFITVSFSVLILALLTILPAAAAVDSWEISPENPTLGDTLRIKGSASPEEEVEIQVSFEKDVQASGGEYEYILEDVKIPDGFNNRFTVQASDARNLNVRVKMLIWITKSSEASGNVATVTQSSVPPGTYQIKMDGDAKNGDSTVNLKITAVQRIKADSGGDFSYSYNTKAVPPGDFKVSVGGTTRKVTLKGKTLAITPAHPLEEIETVTEKNSSEIREKMENNTEAVLNSDQDSENVEHEEVHKSQPVKPQPVEKSGLPVDTVYMLGGMVAALLILILYSKRK